MHSWEANYLHNIVDVDIVFSSVVKTDVMAWRSDDVRGMLSLITA